MGRRKRTVKKVISKMRLPSVLRTKQRQKEVKLRKNFIPTLIIIFLLWTILTYVVFFVDPSNPTAMSVFLIVFFLALMFTISTLIANSRRGIIISGIATIYLFLRSLGIYNIFILLLLIAMGILIEVYLTKA